MQHGTWNWVSSIICLQTDVVKIHNHALKYFKISSEFYDISLHSKTFVMPK